MTMDASTRKKVLVVDDEDYLTDIWREVLKIIDTDVIVAHSGEHAITTLQENTVDMIITDLRMRGSDGFALLEYLTNEVDKKIPTVVCSGFYNESSEELSSFDVTRVMPKPFDVRKELTVLKEILNS
jgi:CheY-like chemotaxis protein